MKLLFALLLSLSATSVLAADCATQTQADDFFKDYKFATMDDDGRPNEVTKFDLCNPEDIGTKIVKAISFLKDIGKVDDGAATSIAMQEGPANYFKKRIQIIVVDSDAISATCNEEGVVAYIARGEGPIMHVCTQGIKTFTSDLMVGYILVHEARHIDGFQHVQCIRGKQDSPVYACDKNFEIQGSYGVGAAYLLDVYRTTSNEPLKQEARSNAVLDLIQRFNTLPLDITEGLLAMNENNQISFYDGYSQKTPMLNNASVNGIATLRYGMLALFNLDGSTETYSFSKNLIETGGTLAKRYREELSPLQRRSIKDIYYSADLYSCVLSETELSCEAGGPETKAVTLKLNTIRPYQFMALERTGVTPVLFIVAENGDIYQLPESFDKLREFSSETQLKKSSQPVPILSSVISNDELYLVSSDGELIVASIKNKDSKPRLVPAYKDEKLKKVMAPYFWSKKLEEL